MIKKIIINLFLVLLLTLVLFVVILSTSGVQTDKFNKLITNKIAKSKNIKLQLQTLNFKLDLRELSLFIETQNPEIKEILRKNTADAEGYGAFGAPSFILHRPHEPVQLFWGQDRLELLCEALISSELSNQKT